MTVLNLDDEVRFQLDEAWWCNNSQPGLLHLGILSVFITQLKARDLSLKISKVSTMAMGKDHICMGMSFTVSLNILSANFLRV